MPTNIDNGIRQLLSKSRWYNCHNSFSIQAHLKTKEISSRIFLYVWTSTADISHKQKAIVFGNLWYFLSKPETLELQFFFLFFFEEHSTARWTHGKPTTAWLWSPLFPKLMFWNVLLAADYQVSLVGDRDTLPTWPERKYTHGNECVRVSRDFCAREREGGDEWLGWIALNKQTHHDGGFFFSRGSLEYSMQRCNSENKCMGKNEHVNKWYTIYTRDKTATTYIVNFFLNINIVQSVNALTGPDRDKARTLAVSSCPLKKCWTAVGRLTALFLGSGSSSFF